MFDLILRLRHDPDQVKGNRGLKRWTTKEQLACIRKTIVVASAPFEVRGQGGGGEGTSQHMEGLRYQQNYQSIRF